MTFFDGRSQSSSSKRRKNVRRVDIRIGIGEDISVTSILIIVLLAEKKSRLGGQRILGATDVNERQMLGKILHLRKQGWKEIVDSLLGQQFESEASNTSRALGERGSIIHEMNDFASRRCNATKSKELVGS